MNRVVIRISRDTGTNFSVVLMILSFIAAYGYIWRLYTYHTMIVYVHFLLVLFLLSFAFRLVKPVPIHGTVIALLFFMTASSVLSNFSRAEEYLVVVYTGACVLTIKHSRRSLDVLFKWVNAVGIVYGLSIIWQWLSPETYYPLLRRIVTESSYERALLYSMDGANTGFVCESAWASLCVTSSIAVNFAALFFKKKEKTTIISILTIVILFFAIILTGRRAFLLLVPAVIGILSIYFLIKNRRGYSRLAGIGLILIAAALFYIFLTDAIVNVLTEGGNGLQLSKREAYWTLALRMFISKPVFGNGLRSYDFNYVNMSGRVLIFAGAHNCYLQMLAEFGIVGTAVYLSMILYMLVKTIRLTTFCIHEKNDLGYYAATALVMQGVYIILALSESPFFFPQPLMMYFMFLSIARNVDVLLTDNQNTIISQ